MMRPGMSNCEMSSVKPTVLVVMEDNVKVQCGKDAKMPKCV